MMEGLKDLGLGLTEKQYRDLDHISYSFLSKLDRMGVEVKDDNFSGNKFTQMGSLIEELVFDEYDPNAYIIGECSPGDTLKQAVDDIFAVAGHDAFLQQDHEKLITTVLEFNSTIGFWEKKEPAWRAAKILKEGEEYIKFLVESKDKVLLSNEEFNICQERADVLKSHEFTKNIFDMDYLESVHSFQGKFTLMGLVVKFMVDLVKVDHVNKRIWLYDLKTGGNKSENFQDSYHYWRYDIQDYLYYCGCIEVFRTYFPDYVVEVMRFVYISTTGKPKPLIYRGLGKHGIIERGYRIDGKKYKGVFELVEDYKWYLKNSFAVEYPERIYLSGGVLDLDFSEAKPLNRT